MCIRFNVLPSICENENDELSTGRRGYWTWGCRYNLRLRKQAAFLSQTMYRRNMHYPMSDRNLVKSRHLCVVTLCTCWRHANEGKLSLIPLTWRLWPPLIHGLGLGEAATVTHYLVTWSNQTITRARTTCLSFKNKTQWLLISISRTANYPNSHGNLR